MKTSGLPPEFRSAKALLSHTQAQRVAALRARFPPWYVRLSDIMEKLVLSVLIVYVVLVYLLHVLATYLEGVRRLIPFVLNGPVHLFLLVVGFVFIAEVSRRAGRFRRSSAIDPFVSTFEQRAAALDEATNRLLIRTEALARLRRFLEGERATLVPGKGATGYRHPARPTSVRVSLIEEAAAQADDLVRNPKVFPEHCLVGQKMPREQFPDGVSGRERACAARFTSAYDTDIAPRLRAAFAR